MKLDPVNLKALKGPHSSAKDKDINNDGEVNSSDEYLHKRRQAVSKALGKLKEAALEEKKLTTKAVKNALASAKAKPKEMVSLKKPPFKMEEVDLDEAESYTHRVGGYYTHRGDDKPVSIKVNASSEKEAKEKASAQLSGNHKNYRPTMVKQLTNEDLDEAKKPKPGHNASVMAKNISKVLAAVKKEEVELDEVSASKLGSYIRKASKNADASMQKRYDAIDNDDRETARKMGRLARKREKGADMAMDKLKGTSYAKVHATEEVTSSKDSTIKAVKPNVSNNNAVTTIADVKPLRMKLSQFRKQE